MAPEEQPARERPDLRAAIGYRGRAILHVATWSGAAKAAAAANLFLTVPYVLNALGPAQFGAWATLVSLVVLAGFLDLGFGNGTMNLIAAAHGRGARAEIAHIVREGRRILNRSALLLAVPLLAATVLAPWHRLLGLDESFASSSRLAAASVMLAVVLSVPLNLAERVQLGLGRGETGFRWRTLGQLAALVVVIILAHADASLPVLTAAAVLTPLCALAANAIRLWRDPALAVREQVEYTNRAVATRIRREGLAFFAMQLSAALAFSADLALISSLRGPVEAGNYAIVQRLFSVVPLALSLLWVPLWPVYRQALSMGQHGWARRTLYRSFSIAVLVASSSALLLLVGFDEIIEHFIRQPISIGWLLLSGFALWCVIESAGSCIATFLNAAGILRFQVSIGVAFAGAAFLLKLLLLQRHGSELVPWITSMTYLAISFFPTLLFSKKLLRQAFTSERYRTVVM